MISSEKKKMSLAGKILACAVLSFAFAIGFLAGVGNVGTKAAEKAATAKADAGKSEKKVTKKEVKKFAKKVDKANDIEKMLKKHTSVYLEDAVNRLWVSRDMVYEANTRDDGRGFAGYANDECCVGLYFTDPVRLCYWINLIPGADKYSITNVRDLINNNITYDEIMMSKPISLETVGDTIVYTCKLTKEDIEGYREVWGIFEGVQTAYSKFTVNAKTHELLEWTAYSEGNEENPENVVRIDYDVPEPFESKIVKSIALRDVYKTVKIKFTQDAGTENEISRELTVPANSDIMPQTINSDGNIYSDPECTKLMEGNWDYNSDLTAYLKSVEAQPSE